MNFYDRYEHLCCDCGGIIGMRDKENFTCDRCGKVHQIENYDWLAINDKTGWLFPMVEKMPSGCVYFEKIEGDKND